MMTVFKDIYSYRELLKTNVKKDIRGRYKGSFLGILWSFINPLLQVVVYAIVFPYLMRGGAIDHYLQYLITGIIPWTFFSTCITVGTTTIKSNAGIVKKVYFPREILPISQVISGLVNFFISCTIILIFCLFGGIGISLHIFLVPVIALIESLFILGIVFILSAINVYVQDIEYIIGFIVNMLFYGTPIVYALEQFSSAGILFEMVRLNPMTMFVQAYRDVFFYHQWPSMISLIILFVLSIGVLIIGFIVFKKLEKGFAEEL